MTLTDQPSPHGPLPQAQQWTTRTLDAIALCLLLFVVAVCLAWPRMDGDAAVYALLAKHMVVLGDPVNLVYQSQDWLDKPHLPFWLVAASFKIFGITERAYLVPGLLCFAAGAWATRQLARQWFDARVSALAVVVYLSVLGGMLAASDQKAEVYLLAFMPAASWAWLRWAAAADVRSGLWWWALGSVMTACALMTKGVFVLIVLGSGLVAQAVFNARRPAWPRWRWWLAGLGTLICLWPELLSLYLQFDAHPEKEVFGRTGVSGLKFFFWDSQFGRFFNTGPIKNTDGSPWFFVHNLLWTFLPWVWALLAAAVVAVLAAVRSVRSWSSMRLAFARPGPGQAPTPQVQGKVFLWASFGVTFALFSATSYQMDYYLVVLFPYAAILAAQWLIDVETTVPRWWWAWHTLIAALLLLAATVFSAVFWFKGGNPCVLAISVLVLLALAALWVVAKWPRPSRFTATLTVGLTAIAPLFAFAVQFNADTYQRYNVGRRVAQSLNAMPPQPVLVTIPHFKTFDFLSTQRVEHFLDARDCSAALGRRLAESDAQGVYVLAWEKDAGALLQAAAQARGAALTWVGSALPAVPTAICPLAVSPGIAGASNAGAANAGAANAGAANTGQAISLQAEVLQHWDDVDLPKQFVGQLLKDETRLKRRGIVLIRVVRV